MTKRRIRCWQCKYFYVDPYHKREGDCRNKEVEKRLFAHSGYENCPITMASTFGCIFGEPK